MSKVAVVYWSGTGHTEAMAQYGLPPLRKPISLPPQSLTQTRRRNTTRLLSAARLWALSSWRIPSLSRCLKPKASLPGKKIALFGSYGWGGGEWMRTWESDCEAAGITLAAESVICQDEPDDDALCRAKLGEAPANN